MKFKTLTVRNFQRHKKRTLEFSNTITTLVGSTDSGKSSLLRALRWICLNDFVGSDFIREGAVATGVYLHFRHAKKDHVLVRKKGERLNTYELDEKEFKSFATNVPEDVVYALQLNKINFQGQHDAPFWFTETAGEVSRRLNAVVDLSVIDTVLSTSARILRDAEITLNISEQRQLGLEETQKQLDPQMARIDQYEKLKQQSEVHEEQIKNTDHLASLVVAAGSYTDELQCLSIQLTAGGALRKRVSGWFQQKQRCDSLHQLLSDMDRLGRIAKPPAFNGILSRYHAATTTARSATELANLVGEVAEMEQTIETALIKSREAAQVFHRATKGERCPMCQNLI